jgi:hypothetical protein
MALFLVLLLLLAAAWGLADYQLSQNEQAPPPVIAPPPAPAAPPIPQPTMEPTAAEVDPINREEASDAAKATDEIPEPSAQETRQEQRQ